jgi:ACS family hexuronate transporter-like MFS transporter
MTDPVWYFFLFWFPKYLLSERGLTIEQVARIGWIVYLFAGVGTLLGGLISGGLIRRGIRPALAYRRTMLLCAAIIPFSPLVGVIPSSLIGVFISSLIALAHMAWLVTLSSAVIDLFPSAEIGKAFGMIAAGSGFGGMISTEVVAYIVMHHGYRPLFFGMMFLHPAALLLLWTTFKEKASVAVATD